MMHSMAKNTIGKVSHRNWLDFVVWLEWLPMVVAGVFGHVRVVVVDFFADVRLAYRECLVYRMLDVVPSSAGTVGVAVPVVAVEFFPTSRPYYRER